MVFPTEKLELKKSDFHLVRKEIPVSYNYFLKCYTLLDSYFFNSENRHSTPDIFLYYIKGRINGISYFRLSADY